jgi:glycosyltransferase involved in cell wall biosynthesis
MMTLALSVFVTLHRSQSTSTQSTSYDTPLIRDTLDRMKLSVMMITYNHEQFIAQAIESVLAQRTTFDYEIVVGEDCSTDRTRDILMDFHRRYPDRIVPLLRDRNLGGPRNLTATLASCQGQYLALLEGDDYWTCEDKLQRQVDFLDGHLDYAICCSRARVANEGGLSSGTLRAKAGGIFPASPSSALADRKEVSGLLPVTPRAAGPYTVEDLLQENFVMTSTVVYRWGGLAPLPSWFLRFSLGDLALHALVANQSKIELLDDCMAVYRVHDGGIWSSRDRMSQVREQARMLKALDRHLGFRYTDIVRPNVAWSYLELATSWRAKGNRRQTANDVFECLRNGGLHLPGGPRLLAGLAAYVLIGSWYKAFSRAKSASLG